MLRIHFTDRDLARTRVATAPDPLWETVLSLHRLRTPTQDNPVFAAWRTRARREIAARSVRPQLGLLCSLVPLRGYFPDFLTPPDAITTLPDGLDILRHTPRGRLRGDLAHGARHRRLPRWTRSLADGNRETLDLLTAAIRDVHDTVVAPGWTDLEADVESDCDHRARLLLGGGLWELFESFDWTSSWDGRVLNADYPYELDIHLRGRGLRLIPSYFCWHQPVALADPDLDPVLVYPVRHRHSWLPRATTGRHRQALDELLGRTRARVLGAVARGPVTTTELARRLAIAPSSASEHVTVLRAAGLVRSRRQANTTLHTVTPIGEALLTGAV